MTLTVGADHEAFGGKREATFKVTASENGEVYYDIISLYKVTDGLSVFLGNENISFSAEADGTIAA